MNSKSEIFNLLFDTFENDDIREFARKCVDTIPDYFWDVGASSTGKYHPTYALGDLGLARHTCAVVRFLNHFFSIDCYKDDYSSRERDLLRVAGMMHDTMKSGNDEDYNKSKFTKFNHPLLAAENIRKMKGYLPDEEIELIATSIESHMGQWNTDKRSSLVLPKPENKYQKILHLADYLASRKDIEVLFDGYGSAQNKNFTVEEYIIDFGKHKGKTLLQVQSEDPGWISWAKENLNREPVKTLLLSL